MAAARARRSSDPEELLVTLLHQSDGKHAVVVADWRASGADVITRLSALPVLRAVPSIASPAVQPDNALTAAVGTPVTIQRLG